jgi:hypothetical protein
MHTNIFIFPSACICMYTLGSTAICVSKIHYQEKLAWRAKEKGGAHAVKYRDKFLMVRRLLNAQLSTGRLIKFISTNAEY